MTLTVCYKNGVRRIVNLHPTFFNSDVDVFFNHKSNRIEKRAISASEKAVILAESLGDYPYSIFLERNGQVQLNRTIRENVPAAKVKEEKVNEKQVKKDLKRECKGQILHTLTHVSF